MNVPSATNCALKKSEADVFLLFCLLRPNKKRVREGEALFGVETTKHVEQNFHKLRQPLRITVSRVPCLLEPKHQEVVSTTARGTVLGAAKCQGQGPDILHHELWLFRSLNFAIFPADQIPLVCVFQQVRLMHQVLEFEKQ